MERWKTIRVDSTESTNTYAKGLPADASDITPLVIVTDNQTAGRGQRGNSWESAPGQNLTFSLVLYPRWLAPSHQFELSMLVSIGIVNALQPFVQHPGMLKIKWPNDIYYGDSKLGGILIENSLGEHCIERSIAGIGINVNQKTFESDAPNPISLSAINGVDFDREMLLDKIVGCILDMTDMYADEPEVDELTALYNRLLWRKDGVAHQWQTPDGQEFEAQLDRVEPDGRIALVDSDGNVRTFLFKEVTAVL